MKIAICSLSELTHVSEFIDAAEALARRHEVRYFVGYPNAESLALLQRRGLPFEVMLETKPALEHPATAASTYDLFSGFFFRQAELILPALLRQMKEWGTEIVFAHLRDFAGLNAAEALGIPVVSFGSHTNPVRREPVDPPFGSGLSRQATAGQKQLMWGLQRDFHFKIDEEYNRRLRRPLGLSAIQNSTTHVSRRLVLLSIIPSLGYGHPSPVHFVGPLCARHKVSPAPEEADLIRELRSSPRPRVFLSLGTTYGTDLRDDCLAAFDGFEGTVITGFFEDVLSVTEACDVVVTVCGGKTVMDALARGKPIVALPRQGEQKEIALALAEEGAAILPCPRKWDAEAFLNAVGEVCHKPSYREAARRLQQEVMDSGRVAEVENLLSRFHLC
jgi:UDP:flavonoid glycosyltransferase YjiC (YdhE family)